MRTRISTLKDVTQRTGWSATSVKLRVVCTLNVETFETKYHRFVLNLNRIFNNSIHEVAPVTAPLFSERPHLSPLNDEKITEFALKLRQGPHTKTREGVIQGTGARAPKLQNMSAKLHET